MGFFTFSTTQEYYSMPCYPALALLIGCAMARGGAFVRGGTVVLTVVSAAAALCCLAILVYVRNTPTPGDISGALSSNPGAYTLSLGHMEDLTLDSFAYLRLPLAVAAIAFLIGAIGTVRAANHRAFLVAGCMMVLFFHAARLAMVVFDPYLSSRPLARKLAQSPAGELIVNHHYYEFSSIFFYTNRTAWLLNGRFNNLVYGSYAPGAPDVFLDDAGFQNRWSRPQREYFVADKEGVQRIESLVAKTTLNIVVASGGKYQLPTSLCRAQRFSAQAAERLFDDAKFFRSSSLIVSPRPGSHRSNRWSRSPGGSPSKIYQKNSLPISTSTPGNIPPSANSDWP